MLKSGTRLVEDLKNFKLLNSLLLLVHKKFMQVLLYVGYLNSFDSITI